MTRTFQIDKTHSRPPSGASPDQQGPRRFADFEGTIEFDEEKPAQSKVNVTIQTASVDTNTPDRDVHLRSDDFFAVEKHPTLSFVSTTVTPKGNGDFDVAGHLTMRGVTKGIVIPVSYLGKAQDPWGNEKVAFEGEVKLNRKDFGLNWNAAIEAGGFLVGDEVKVSLSVQAAAQK
jgi:polyisoprenoid-binding protein YceI